MKRQTLSSLRTLTIGQPATRGIHSGIGAKALNVIKGINLQNQRLYSVNKYGEWITPKPQAYDPPAFPLKERQESIHVLRKRLLYNSRKRGILETDLLLSSWAQKNLDKLDLMGLKEYELLLHENDWNIYYWLTDGLEAPEHIMKLGILKSLKLHSLNLDKKILKMPSLD